MAYKRTTTSTGNKNNRQRRTVTQNINGGSHTSYSNTHGRKGNGTRTVTQGKTGTWITDTSASGWITKRKVSSTIPKKPRKTTSRRVSKKQQEQQAIGLLVVGVGLAVVYGLLYVYVTVSEFLKTIFG